MLHISVQRRNKISYKDETKIKFKAEKFRSRAFSFAVQQHAVEVMHERDVCAKPRELRWLSRLTRLQMHGAAAYVQQDLIWLQCNNFSGLSPEARCT